MSQDSPDSPISGYLFAFGSAAAIAATFLVRKSVSNAVNPTTFSVWWYGLSGIYAWVWTLLRGQPAQIGRASRAWKPLLALILCNAAAAILYFTEIDMTNPALVAFFGRLRTVYTILLGIVLLGERLNRREWAGAAITVLGTLIIAYKGGTALNTVFVLALIENLLMAVTTVTARLVVQHISPLVLTGVRGVTMAALLFVYALIAGQWQPVDGKTLLALSAGAFVGPFIGYVLRYSALARIDAG
ncbi:MAG: EamA family transporter, partial [Anaerolineae bacterium]|nr:EamA family transporter [Anaerolineae bacterium]